MCARSSVLKWLVEMRYQTMAGNPAARRYVVKATNPSSAMKLAQVRLERLKSFAKSYGGDAVPYEEK